MGCHGRRFRGARNGEGPGQRRHQPGQLRQPLSVFAGEYRRPDRYGLTVPLGQGGQELLPDRQGQCKPQCLGPVGQVGADDDAGFQHALPVAGLQQPDGLLRVRTQRGYCPRSDAGLGPGSGHRASQGAGGHRGVAPAGQPGDGAVEAVVACFQAGRFGQEPGSGAVGVLSSRLPGGRSVARAGVLGPEDQVSLNRGGVEDEHGVVRCCVEASVDDGKLLWQGAEEFQQRLGAIRRVTNAAGGDPTGFWCGRSHRPGGSTHHGDPVPPGC